ncbi:hypothetical protein EJB05_19903 [Eragrostis curvula]|uniref:Uncharacterized protein n=1 Tax=Eragrostis curvula TaxID=38414 RepID=A0A5J9UXM4_9POAL|nr:hypothetical protein EJB05_19902 [Eragrostis curvula]TVU28386.1 hypothetical protein EJB05_19903 [Eragrostis curvula]
MTAAFFLDSAGSWRASDSHCAARTASPSPSARGDDMDSTRAHMRRSGDESRRGRGNRRGHVSEHGAMRSSGDW